MFPYKRLIYQKLYYFSNFFLSVCGKFNNGAYGMVETDVKNWVLAIVPQA